MTEAKRISAIDSTVSKMIPEADDVLIFDKSGTLHILSNQVKNFSGDIFVGIAEADWTPEQRAAHIIRPGTPFLGSVGKGDVARHEIAQAIREAVAAEREACAKVCDECSALGGEGIAPIIRARGQ